MSKNDAKKECISIADCRICNNILQKQSAIEEEGERLPKEAKELVEIVPYLKKCPLCGTYYEYQYDYDRGEPLVPPETTHTLIRLGLIRTQVMLLARGAKEEYKDLLKKEHEELQERYDELIDDLITVLNDSYEKLNWHVKKYIIEVLSDHYLQKNDWKGFSKVLLNHKDPVVRVEAACDLIYVATEEFPVWCERDFTEQQQKKAKKFLDEDMEKLSELILVLAKGLFDEGTALNLDAVLGYRERSVNGSAYSGLRNAVYRGIDISPAIPALLEWLSDENELYRKGAYELLEKYIKKKKRNARVVLDQINKSEINKSYQEVKKIIRKCKSKHKEV